MLSTLALLAASAFGADAADSAPSTPTPWANETDEEVVVWGDLFARWDHTRWEVATEIGLPYSMKFMRDTNTEFWTNGFQVRTILACDKDYKLGNRKYEVSCVIEDFAIQAVISDKDDPKPNRVADAQEILDQIDARLTNARLQLHVADDGRVTDLDLEGVDADNSRESTMTETLRQVLSRVTVGFDLRGQKYNQLHEGKWLEYNSKLMTMPVPADGTSVRASSMLVHYLNRFEGHVLVQTIGRGMITLPSRDDSYEATYKCDLTGVSIYDENEGFMSERVWALEGTPTASTLFNTTPYWHAGRITMLGETDHPDLGPTQVVSPRGKPITGLPAWKSIEER